MAFTLAQFVGSASAALAGGAVRDLASKRALGYLNWTRKPPQIPPPRGAGRPRRRHPRPSARTTSRSPGDLVNLALEAEFAPSRAWLEKAWAKPSAHRHPRQPRRLMCAPQGIARRKHGETICAAMSMAERRVSLRAQARTGGADRRVLRGANAAFDGDGQAWVGADAGARSHPHAACFRAGFFVCCWCIIHCTRPRG